MAADGPVLYYYPRYSSRSNNGSGSAMQTDTAGSSNDCAVQTEHHNDRYVITNNVSCGYYCQICGFYT